MGKVQILSERLLPEVLEGALPPSHRKFCICDKDAESTPVGFGAEGDHAQVLKQWLAADRIKKKKVSK